jgi:hypothetical protein
MPSIKSLLLLTTLPLLVLAAPPPASDIQTLDLASLASNGTHTTALEARDKTWHYKCVTDTQCGGGGVRQEVPVPAVELQGP